MFLYFCNLHLLLISLHYDCKNILPLLHEGLQLLEKIWKLEEVWELETDQGKLVFDD